MPILFDYKGNKGSSTIEAAMIIPLVILIIAAFIRIAAKREVMVWANSKENILLATAFLKDGIINIEDVLRGIWTAK